MYGVLNEYPRLSTPGTGPHAYQLSALLAMLETARKMQPSGPLLDKYQQSLLDSCRRAGFPEEVIANSLTYAQAVSRDILAYAKADSYNKISNFSRYAPLNKEGSWYPTPPGFFAAGGAVLQHGAPLHPRFGQPVQTRPAGAFFAR